MHSARYEKTEEWVRNESAHRQQMQEEEEAEEEVFMDIELQVDLQVDEKWEVDGRGNLSISGFGGGGGSVPSGLAHEKWEVDGRGNLSDLSPGGGGEGGGVPPINLPLWRGNLSDLSPEVRQLPLQRSERQILADIPAGVGGISGFGGGGGSVPSGLVHDMQAVRDVACISLRGRAVRYAPIFYNFAHPMPSVASMPGLFYLNTRLLTLVRTSGMPRFTITRLLTSSIPPFRLPLEEEEEEEWRRSAAATTGTEECRSSSNDRNT